MATTPDNLTLAVEARRLADQTSEPLATLRGLPVQIFDRLIALRNSINQMNMDDSLSSRGKLQRERELRDGALRDLDALQSRAQDARAALERAIAAAGQRPTDPQAELLEEIRQQRAWQRWQPLLAKLETTALLARIHAIAEAAAKDGDLPTLRALEAELPAFFEARGVAGYTQPVLADVRAALLPHLPPVARKAESIRAELAEGWPRLMAAFQMARREVTGEGQLAVLPGWQATEQVTP